MKKVLLRIFLRRFLKLLKHRKLIRVLRVVINQVNFWREILIEMEIKGNPWPPVSSVEEISGKSNELKEIDIITQELKCYHSRIPYTDDILVSKL